jgi:hypothetical protein
MKKLSILFFALLTGCAQVSQLTDMIPSRWDPNQSKVVTDLRQSTQNFDCLGNVSEQLKNIHKEIQWFELYSESKNTKDVLDLVKTLDNTTNEFIDRVKQGPVSPLYCDLKKKILIQEANTIAHTVQRRW